jgi:hypothetical protein
MDNEWDWGSHMADVLARLQDLIDAAHGGNSDAGRKVIRVCVNLLRSEDPLPDNLRKYLADKLEAALDVPAEDVSIALNISRSAHGETGIRHPYYPQFAAWFIQKVKESGFDNLPKKDGSLAREFLNTLPGDGDIKISERTVRRWLERDRDLMPMMFAIFSSEEPPEIPPDMDK